MSTDLSHRFNRHTTASKAAGLTYYNAATPVRTLHLAPVDGPRLFLNYSDLVSGEFSSGENTITLTFTKHVVTLKGSNLDALFDSLSVHGVRLITMVDDRYTETTEEAQGMVTQIEVRHL